MSVVEVLASVATLSCLGTAAIAAAQTGLGRYRWAGTAPRLGVVQALTTGLAVADAASLALGHVPRELATHLAYLVVSVAVLPAAATQLHGDDGRWAGVLVTAALVVTAVVVVRQLTTWRAGA